MKLLVTTDFSTNSKGAIRFANTLSKQASDVEVIFYHAIHILKPTRWSDSFYKTYKDDEIARLTLLLKRFINATLGKAKDNFVNIKYVVDNCVSTEKDIVKFAQKNEMDFICIATQGAGMLRKVMGTHTSYIVNNSKVPVLVIPSRYRSKQLRNATYLSDFENFKTEVSTVSKLANLISLDVEVLHYTSSVLDKNKFENSKGLFNTKEFEHITLNVQKDDLHLSLVNRVTKYVQKAKPQLLIMFTNREKGFFESLFIPSKSVELTYSTKVPVLIFSK